MKLYKKGYTGESLKKYQEKLGIAVDGIFGPQTDGAVRAFQKNHNLHIDGIIGEDTQAKFNHLANKPFVDAKGLHKEYEDAFKDFGNLKNEMSSTNKLESPFKQDTQTQVADTIPGQEWETRQKEQVMKWEENQKREFERFHNTLSSNIGSEKSNAVARITEAFKGRMEEQKRINTANEDRIRAYSVAGGSTSSKALFTPFMFSDIITKREEEGLEEINKINIELENKLREIEVAFEGRDLMNAKGKLKNYRELRKMLNDKVDNIERESERQRKLLVEHRKNMFEEQKREMDMINLRLKNVFINKPEILKLTGQDLLNKAQSIADSTGTSIYAILNTIQEAKTEAVSGGIDTNLQLSKLKHRESMTKRVQAGIANIKNKMWNRDRRTTDQIQKRRDHRPPETGAGELTEEDRKRIREQFLI